MNGDLLVAQTAMVATSSSRQCTILFTVIYLRPRKDWPTVELENETELNAGSYRRLSLIHKTDSPIEDYVSQSSFGKTKSQMPNIFI